MEAAVVTGGGRGLGAAICRHLGKRGYLVFVGHRQYAGDAEGVVADIRRDGGQAELLSIDVSRGPSVDEAFETVRARDEPLALLVNNAGITRDGWFVMSTEADWNDIIDVNLHGAARCTRAAARNMMTRRAGAIVHIGSLAGLRASPGQASYSASKAALVGLTKTSAAELGRYGIRVNLVAAGFIDAGLTKRTPAEALADRQAAIPLGRLGHAEEVAQAVGFLASSEASYVTGAVLPVDGGLSA